MPKTRWKTPIWKRALRHYLHKREKFHATGNVCPADVKQNAKDAFDSACRKYTVYVELHSFKKWTQEIFQTAAGRARYPCLYRYVCDHSTGAPARRTRRIPSFSTPAHVSRAYPYSSTTSTKQAENQA